MAPRAYWLARLAAFLAVVGCGVAIATIGLADIIAGGLGPRVLASTWAGVMTGGISVSVLHFFAVHCNSSSRWQKMAGESQYAVYVLQTIVTPAVMLTLLPILRAGGHTVEFEFDLSNKTFVSRNELPQWVIVGGWIYTVVLVTVISWPLGFLFNDPELRWVLLKKDVPPLDIGGYWLMLLLYAAKALSMLAALMLFAGPTRGFIDRAVERTGERSMMVYMVHMVFIMVPGEFLCPASFITPEHTGSTAIILLFILAIAVNLLCGSDLTAWVFQPLMEPLSTISGVRAQVKNILKT